MNKDLRNHMTMVCIDFDGVLHQYYGWKGADVIDGEPVDGAMAWLQRMVEAGVDVCVYSARSSEPGGIPAMRDWLSRHATPQIVEGLSFPLHKPPAHLTIDDRAFCFCGRFPDLDEIRFFRPWWKKENDSTSTDS